MSKSVFGIATTQGQAEQIVRQLQAQGFGTSEISVLMPDTGGTRDIGHVKATKAPEGATTGAATGGATGGGRSSDGRCRGRSDWSRHSGDRGKALRGETEKGKLPDRRAHG